MLKRINKVLLNFLVTIKAAPHECVIRTGILKGAWVLKRNNTVLLKFLVTVKATPHECVIRTGLP